MDDTVATAARPSELTLNARSTRRAIVSELRLVEGAIALVAAGAAPQVTVGGLAFGEQILSLVAPLARRRRVRVHELWSPVSDVSQVEVQAGA